MDPREMWEETVRQMRESPEFQDAGVMYAQGEIERLKEENERLEAAFLAEHQAAVDQFGTAEDLRDENERLRGDADLCEWLIERLHPTPDKNIACLEIMVRRGASLIDAKAKRIAIVDKRETELARSAERATIMPNP